MQPLEIINLEFFNLIFFLLIILQNWPLFAHLIFGEYMQIYFSLKNSLFSPLKSLFFVQKENFLPKHPLSNLTSQGCSEQANHIFLRHIIFAALKTTLPWFPSCYCVLSHSL